MDMEVTKTSLNVAALIGWAALLLGIVAVILILTIEFTVMRAIGAGMGLVGGAIAITNAGPLRKVERFKVKARRHE